MCSRLWRFVYVPLSGSCAEARFAVFCVEMRSLHIHSCVWFTFFNFVITLSVDFVLNCVLLPPSATRLLPKRSDYMPNRSKRRGDWCERRSWRRDWRTKACDGRNRYVTLATSLEYEFDSVLFVFLTSRCSVLHVEEEILCHIKWSFTLLFLWFSNKGRHRNSATQKQHAFFSNTSKHLLWQNILQFRVLASNWQDFSKNTLVR